MAMQLFQAKSHAIKTLAVSYVVNQYYPISILVICIWIYIVSAQSTQKNDQMSINYTNKIDSIILKPIIKIDINLLMPIQKG